MVLHLLHSEDLWYILFYPNGAAKLGKRKVILLFAGCTSVLAVVITGQDATTSAAGRALDAGGIATRPCSSCSAVPRIVPFWFAPSSLPLPLSSCLSLQELSFKCGHVSPLHDFLLDVNYGPNKAPFYSSVFFS